MKYIYYAQNNILAYTYVYKAHKRITCACDIAMICIVAISVLCFFSHC